MIESSHIAVPASPEHRLVQFLGPIAFFAGAVLLEKPDQIRIEREP
ncbi:hypothetical protein PGTUg99_020760 [Puccinia graminis f. sp. tritici]|uniref:Uncharacterized protein n=1 Tax=Puccinia graminis f. sp. tritici TaxID=56615 RepID=A0A5B0RVX6_PUCGR|nr:hypothetical protein PGTUg99_020760 [Puccinia graminis f. sp. tritici]